MHKLGDKSRELLTYCRNSLRTAFLQAQIEGSIVNVKVYKPFIVHDPEKTKIRTERVKQQRWISMLLTDSTQADRH
jgi:hypothetical protein